MPKPKKSGRNYCDPVHVRLKPSTKAAAERAARKDNRRPGVWYRIAIEEKLERGDK